MINQTELRIGNYIYDDENVIVKVERIDSTHYNNWNGEGNPPVLFSINGDIRESDVINPVKLTEEILIMAGFEKTTGKRGDYFFHKVFNGFRLWIDNITPNYNVGRKSDAKTYWVAGGIKSLHQLQNIFYALTASELEVKL